MKQPNAPGAQSTTPAPQPQQQQFAPAEEGAGLVGLGAGEPGLDGIALFIGERVKCVGHRQIGQRVLGLGHRTPRQFRRARRPSRIRDFTVARFADNRSDTCGYVRPS
mgnify:CR=1 FL=1